MRDCDQAKSLSQEAPSDSSEDSTKVLPSTGPNSPGDQTSTVLTRGRLTRITMQAQYQNGKKESLLAVDQNGRRPADDLLTQYFRFEDRTRHSGQQLWGPGERVVSEKPSNALAEELERLDTEAYYSRIERVTREMREDGNRLGEANGTSAGPLSVSNDTIPPSAPSYATERRASNQQSRSNRRTHRSGEHSSSSRRQ